MKARLDRIAGNAEARRRLLDAHLLDRAQHEDAAEIRWQLVYRFLDGAADLPPGDCLLRRRICLGGEKAVSCRQGFRHLANIDGRTPPPQPRKGFVGNDPRQPGSKTRSAPEPVELGESTDIAVVNRFLGLQVISEKPTSEPVQPLVIAAHQRGKGRRVSRAHPGEQGGIGEAFLSSLGSFEVHSTPPTAVKPLDAPLAQGFPSSTFLSAQPRRGSKAVLGSAVPGFRPARYSYVCVCLRGGPVPWRLMPRCFARCT